MRKSYLTTGGRLIQRARNGRFRRSTMPDIGVPKASLQSGAAICADCGYGLDEFWHPILKDGFCPQCESERKISQDEIDGLCSGLQMILPIFA